MEGPRHRFSLSTDCLNQSKQGQSLQLQSTDSDSALKNHSFSLEVPLVKKTLIKSASLVEKPNNSSFSSVDTSFFSHTSSTGTPDIQKAPFRSLHNSHNALALRTATVGSSYKLNDQPNISPISFLIFVTKIFILPSLFVPLLLLFIPLQNPYEQNGYEDNWAWAGIFMPASSILLSIFPTFIVASIMGSPETPVKSAAWKISSITFSSGISIIAYSVISTKLYHFFNPEHPFPVPWTPLWLTPFLCICSAFTSRFIRLISDWNLVEERLNNPQAPPPSSLRFALNKIKALVRNSILLYTLSMILSGLLLMLSDPASFTAPKKFLEMLGSNAKGYQLPLINAISVFVLLPLGKFLSRRLMAKTLLSGGFYSLSSNSSLAKTDDGSKPLPNINVNIMGCEYWWSLTEVLLIVIFNENYQTVLLALFNLLESAYFINKARYLEKCKRFSAPNIDVESPIENNAHELPLTNNNLGYSSVSSRVFPTPPLSDKYTGAHATSSHSHNPSLKTFDDFDKLSKSRATLNDAINTTQLTSNLNFKGGIPISKKNYSKECMRHSDSDISESTKNPLIESPKYVGDPKPHLSYQTQLRVPLEISEPQNDDDFLNFQISDAVTTAFSITLLKLVGFTHMVLLSLCSGRLNPYYVKPVSGKRMMVMGLFYSICFVLLYLIGNRFRVDVMGQSKKVISKTSSSWVALGCASMGYSVFWMFLHGGT